MVLLIIYLDGGWTHFMIRSRKIFLCLTILLANCSQLQVDYSKVGIDYSYFEYFKNAYFPEKIEIDYEIYEQSNLSYLKITPEDDIFTWVGKDFELIKTFQGIIIEMTGPYHLEIYGADISAFNLFNERNSIRYTFFNPDLVMHQFTFELDTLEELEECTLVRYIRKSKPLGFNSKEEICYGKKLPIRSSQKLNNLIGSFELEFNYKY
jgi:hypothetical protein